MTSPDTVESDERLRLFCALTLPEPVLERIVEWQDGELAGDARIVPRNNLHATVAFLGSRPASEAASIGVELCAAAASAGPIVLRELRYRETRSVGMLVLKDLAGSATRLAEALFARLEALGVYERERRAWLPHVTVLRFRRPPRLKLPLPGLGEVVPSDAAVYLSQLGPKGAQYFVVESFVLGG